MSIRQPIVLYATIFMVFIAFGVVTVASFSLVKASRRAYRRAAAYELRALAATGSPELLAGAIRAHQRSFSEIDLGIVTTATSAFGLGIDFARAEERQPAHEDRFVVTRLPFYTEEAYLVGLLDPSIPLSIAFVEIGRMIPLVLFGALACAAFLAFTIGRLLLPQLRTLAEVAQDAHLETEGLTATDAPNEIVEVARRFRQTMRALHHERDRIKAQRDELERMQESLVRASKLASVGRLAAGIAHEIGNPLAAVRGYLSLLKEGLPDQERAEVIERSSKELTRIHETIKQLLTYARKGEDASTPLAPFSTAVVVSDALSLVRGHRSIRQVNIVCDLSSSDPPDAVGHADRLNQVLVNLLLNAGQALEGRDPRTIWIRREQHGSRLHLVVEDDGPGIPTDQLESVFDPFFTTKAPGEGTGLGLAVSRALMEAMGGDLVVESENGRGARFTVKLEASFGGSLC